MRSLFLLVLVASLFFPELFSPERLHAQSLPSCTGTDAAGASAAFEAGNALMQEATTEARARRRDRARELAAEALTHFDQQCELGDPGALAERGAALMLMGEPLRSAQSYDGYLSVYPLDTLDARTRRRIEPNLQPGSLVVELTGRSSAHLFVGDLDFGPISRVGPVRLPYGEYAIEARSGDEVIASSQITLSAESPSSTLLVRGSETATAITEPDLEPRSHRDASDVVVGPDRPSPSTRTDYTAWYAATGVATAVFLGAAIGLQLWADERARTYNDFCTMGPALGCESVRTEYDGLFGAFITSYVLTGIAAIGLVTVLALDLLQPSSTNSASVSCGMGPLSMSCHGSF